MRLLSVLTLCSVISIVALPFLVSLLINQSISVSVTPVSTVTGCQGLERERSKSVLPSYKLEGFRLPLVLANIEQVRLNE